MYQNSLAEKPEKSLSLLSDRNRDKMASTDQEFPVAVLNLMSSQESLDPSSALEMSKLYFNHRYGTNTDKTQQSHFRKKVAPYRPELTVHTYTSTAHKTTPLSKPPPLVIFWVVIHQGVLQYQTSPTCCQRSPASKGHTALAMHRCCQCRERI